MTRNKLSGPDIDAALVQLPGWAREGDAIAKTFTFARFAEGIAFVQRVAGAADAMNHHPDIDIRYTKVRIALSTHDAGGITAADVKLATEIQHAA